jgi:hypothetical protein
MNWRRWGTALLMTLAMIGLAVYGLAFRPLRDPHPRSHPAPGLLGIRDAKIYTSPDAPPLEHASLLVRDGIIVALGSDVPIPDDARILACHHCVVTAGFWNSHVHFSEDKWNFSDWETADALNAQLVDMLTRRGFTTVVDTGSNPRNTLPLRRARQGRRSRGPAHRPGARYGGLCINRVHRPRRTNSVRRPMSGAQ